jgi:hypothetical protein
MIVCGCGGGGGNGASVPSYRATKITAVPPISYAPLSINDAGTVAGSMTAPAGLNVPFEWSAANGLTALALAAKGASGAITAISGDGTRVGWDTGGTGGVQEGLIWPSGWIYPVAVGGIGSKPQPTELRAIDNGNTAVGWTIVPPGTPQAFRCSSPEVLIEMSLQSGYPYAENDSNVIVGGFTPTGPAFSYSPATGVTKLPNLPGQTFGVATAINASGNSVGYSGPLLGCEWTPSGPISLGPNPAGAQLQSYGFGINASGWIVGGVSAPGPSANGAFVRSPGGQSWSLTALTRGLPTSVSLTCASAINSAGQIAAFGSDGNAYFLDPRSTPASRPRS